MLIVKLYVTLLSAIIAGLVNSVFCKSNILKELKKNKLPSINALIRDGNVNLKYGEDKITNQYEYVLLKRDVEWLI